MKVENPVALRFILEDELYLLNADKELYAANTISVEHPPVIVAEPAIIPETKPEIKTPLIDFNYLGKNLKNFLILVHYPDIEFIKDVHLTALENILKRKDFSIDDVAIVNTAKYQTSAFKELTVFFKPTKLLALGKEALPMGIDELKLNSPKSLVNYTALYSFSFNEMMDNTEYKKAFWEQMKQL